jgi:tyramine---L-glutamate ligase
MIIFIFEYTCAAWAGQSLPASLRAEGLAMLAAVLEDFGRIPGVRTCTLLADDFAQALSHDDQRSGTDERAAFLRLAGQADYTLVIAPEFDDLLATRCQWVEEAGGRSLNASVEAIRLTGDKYELARHLGQQQVRTPPTFLFSTLMFPGASGLCLPSWRQDSNPAEITIGRIGILPPRFVENNYDSFPAIYKPRFGAGSQATFLVHSESELKRCLDVARAEGFTGEAILQPFIPGQPASVAFLIGSGQRLALWPAAQHLSSDGRFHYLGGTVPLAERYRQRAVTLAERASACVPGLRGYVGVDLVLGDAEDGSGDAVIEINPRLTTSYIGLRRLTPVNLAQVMLKMTATADPVVGPELVRQDVDCGSSASRSASEANHSLLPGRKVGDAAMNLPIPADALNHCVILFERRENILPQFLEAFTDRFPRADTAPQSWTAAVQPRPMAFGPLSWQRWHFHILIDLQGMPPPVASIIGQAEMQPHARDAVERHQVCCMLFLTDAPEISQPSEQDRALARAAWAMLDVGADVLIWPRTGLGWHREELEDFAPETFDPGWSSV